MPSATRTLLELARVRPNPSSQCTKNTAQTATDCAGRSISYEYPALTILGADASSISQLDAGRFGNSNQAYLPTVGGDSVADGEGDGCKKVLENDGQPLHRRRSRLLQSANGLALRFDAFVCLFWR